MQINDLSEDVEAVSAFYAQRHSIQRTDDWFMLKLNEEVGELTQAYLAGAGQARDKGRTSAELATSLKRANWLARCCCCVWVGATDPHASAA